MYGITETTVHVTYRPLSAADLERAGSGIGIPIPDLTVHLLDRSGRPVPIGVAGEIHVGGAGVALGYLGRPELTAERFVPDPFAAAPGARLYRAGDLARRRPDGDLEYLGRIDRRTSSRRPNAPPSDLRLPGLTLVPAEPAAQSAKFDLVVNVGRARQVAPRPQLVDQLLERQVYDYHWYRQDTNGLWTHKPGGTQATNLDNSSHPIPNPETADRGPYTSFCGYFCSCSSSTEGSGHENIN